MYDILLAADHQAVAALQTEDAAARANIDIVEARGDFRSPPRLISSW